MGGIVKEWGAEALVFIASFIIVTGACATDKFKACHQATKDTITDTIKKTK